MSSSKEVIKKIERDGWYLVRVVGSHHHFKHPTRKGKVTVPHPKKIYHVGQNAQFYSPLHLLDLEG
ncbi:addiction module toxin, HicA family [Staphylococcus pseudintermedius]|uniref:type II toxin-antitoxin system HicA family toxin n=1 Tax=Staphylococcus pseudintermedius TaxID=283734 RepID=UPI0018F55EBB|nr:type II toxin-antitoxin system HicA family toxin [Staphylococcus pseudintermedius]EGQ1604605.1 type II toxin-antitoxin system HicA family toxin [Staphylococcus pseudintermedius]EGQ2883045.1 type II toxin-antitoxin system HicA family toxin [Staphylococcus pseudintermedius]EGQ2943780.1 addiction module toxin, HicA family [Staphylococcus pseudintermedius]EGQ3427668.1 type II toxin-antitoxin system HicA family toxin [Staphylococcus pseudintermedius]EGQ3483799.1 type II toxin-antitoxin system Hi